MCVSMHIYVCIHVCVCVHARVYAHMCMWGSCVYPLDYSSEHMKQVDILISKNQALQIYLKHHDNVYKTP